MLFQCLENYKRCNHCISVAVHFILIAKATEDGKNRARKAALASVLLMLLLHPVHNQLDWDQVRLEARLKPETLNAICGTPHYPFRGKKHCCTGWCRLK